ncbi:Uncharacterized conserved protein, DUF1697 family [Kaistia soli DSM 19436]|uniref:Uncharacterized conserved protein, DUF1697 family n=1 Tax=Kaistia soli DSM 19436 TaxID=1122133 RepID=A0A1M4W8M1_9HYPH|nr:DUF1697 domain-containing protein [Kaistia soli]SHE77566.1 Uncharacterized conserved protein, DUF1697 family [Kaistia soli DSM 19436]
MASYVALLYSIVLGEGRRVVMADLRAMAAELGLDNPQTVVATGNLVFDSAETPLATLERQLEGAFADRFGKRIDFILRRADDWHRLAVGNPFRTAAGADGSLVHVRVMREKLTASELQRLAPYATGGEQLRLVDGDLWIYFAGQRPSEGRMLGQLTARRGGIGTVRNWNTVARIVALLDARMSG